jgi:hypothetical protein
MRNQLSRVQPANSKLGGIFCQAKSVVTGASSTGAGDISDGYQWGEGEMTRVTIYLIFITIR